MHGTAVPQGSAPRDDVDVVCAYDSYYIKGGRARAQLAHRRTIVMSFHFGGDVNATDNWTVSTNASCSAQGHLGLYRQIVGTVFFVFVWPIVVFDIKRFPIGRPAAALLGGALMVIFYVVTQDAAYAVIGGRV